MSQVTEAVPYWMAEPAQPTEKKTIFVVVYLGTITHKMLLIVILTTYYISQRHYQLS